VRRKDGRRRRRRFLLLLQFSRADRVGADLTRRFFAPSSLPPSLPPSSRAALRDPEKVPGFSPRGVARAHLGGWHALCVDFDGAAYAWGGNEYGQAGVDCGVAGHGVHVSLHLSVPTRLPFGGPGGNVKIKQVACGGMHSFAVADGTGEVYQWGQIAGSEKAPARAPAKLRGIRGVVALAAGAFHAIALQDDGRVLSWGNGDYGQLGLGLPGNEDAPVVVEALRRVLIHSHWSPYDRVGVVNADP
jgi:alpha-tubulin suppressor-like RCC1 family protein